MGKATLLSISLLAAVSCLLPESAQAHGRAHRHRHGNGPYHTSHHHGRPVRVRTVCETTRDWYNGGYYQTCYDEVRPVRRNRHRHPPVIPFSINLSF